MADDPGSQGPIRRRRRRAHRPAGPAATGRAPADPGASIENPPPEQPREAERSSTRSGRARADDHRRGSSPAGRSRREGADNSRQRRTEERGWRDLAGSGPSQIGVSGALRARDVARPAEADLAAAEAELVIVRRGWQPPSV